jgi:ATP-binding protein involved in chromosome partitioning
MSNINPGARRKCDELGIQLLGDIPLHPQICRDADAGKPTVVANPESPQAPAFTKIMERLHTELGLR